MRGDEHVVAPDERGVLRRLRRQHVEPRGGDTPVFQRPRQCVTVDDTAAADDLLGSTTERVIRTADATVVSVPVSE